MLKLPLKTQSLHGARFWAQDTFNSCLVVVLIDFSSCAPHPWQPLPQCPSSSAPGGIWIEWVLLVPTYLWWMETGCAWHKWHRFAFWAPTSKRPLSCNIVSFLFYFSYILVWTQVFLVILTLHQMVSGNLMSVAKDSTIFFTSRMPNRWRKQSNSGKVILLRTTLVYGHGMEDCHKVRWGKVMCCESLHSNSVAWFWGTPFGLIGGTYMPLCLIYLHAQSP